jgi:hypothetical protein
MTPASSVVEKAVDQNPEWRTDLDQAPELAALLRRRGKLGRGAWSWLRAHLLLGGPADPPWDYRFLEDDYRRLARRPQENRVFWQR